MVKIEIINKRTYNNGIEEDNLYRIDVISLLKLKPTKLYFEGLYLSGLEWDLISEYSKKIKEDTGEWIKRITINCFINFDDNSFYKEEDKRENIRIKKFTRFEIMDI